MASCSSLFPDGDFAVCGEAAGPQAACSRDVSAVSFIASALRSD